MALSCKILSLLLLGVVLLQLLATANGQYVMIGEKYYRPITTQKVNWYRAYQICAALGMELASIESQNDLTELKNHLFSQSQLSSNYWLAANNLADRGEYVWLSSGRKFSYTSWAPSQPDKLANRCVRTDYNFNWVSDSCAKPNYFICSKPIVPDCGIYGQCTDNVNYLF